MFLGEGASGGTLPAAVSRVRTLPASPNLYFLQL
jgi:hypothetical protein